MKKPNADIEWYDDGFTMEEQAKLREEYLKHRPKITISAKQQEDWKDKMISNLKTKNAANEEYIKELEDQIKQLKNLNEGLTQSRDAAKQKYTEIANRYSMDINQYVQSEEFQEKYILKIKELEKRNSELSKVRDELVYKLLHNVNV
jgi:predicted  nucleic acid-binding Zn-ribbon protein